MHQSLKALDMAIRWLCTVSLGVAAVCIALMAIIGTADVIGTSLLAKPLPSALELSEVALVIVVFTGLAAAQMKGAHITVDIASGHFTGWLRHLSLVSARLAAMVCFGTIAWLGTLEAIHSWNINEYASGGTPIPIYPGKILLAFGCGVATLEAFRQLIHILFDTSPPKSENHAEATI